MIPRAGKGAAGAVAVIGAALAALCLRGTIGAGWPWDAFTQSYALGNLSIGTALTVTGVVLAWFRPHLVTGWLFAAAGLAYLTSAAALGLADAWQGTTPAGPLAGAVTAGAWPLAIGIFISLALLSVPTGRLRGTANRALVALVLLTGTAFWLPFALYPATEFDNALALPAEVYFGLQPVWFAVNAASMLVWCAIVVMLVLRYRRGDEQIRRQLMWVLFGLLVAILVSVPVTMFGAGDAVLLVIMVVIPASVIVALLRHRLLDIRLVVARSVAWVLLAGIVIAAHLTLVVVLTPVLAPDGGLAAVALSGLLVALAFEPLRRLLQAGIDRLLFGRRGPHAVARMIRDRIAVADSLDDLIDGLRDAMGVPALRFEVRGLGVVATSGDLGDEPVRLSLAAAGERTGTLDVAVRRGDGGLRRADRNLLRVIEPSLGLLAQSMRLADELARSRSRIVEATELERIRLQRDLHDEIASALTGIQFKVEAARTTSGSTQLADVSGDLRRTLGSLRQVIDDLRPPELDRVGLSAALQDRLAHRVRADGRDVRVSVAAGSMAALPAALEVTAYRIAVEAATNALRHSAAGTITIDLRLDDDAALTVEVRDDGGPAPGFAEGTGLRSMRERAGQIGGEVTIVGASTGTTVRARLPFPHSTREPVDV